MKNEGVNQINSYMNLFEDHFKRYQANPSADELSTMRKIAKHLHQQCLLEDARFHLNKGDIRSAMDRCFEALADNTSQGREECVVLLKEIMARQPSNISI